MKKAQGLPISTIIIAVLALIVLVIVIAIVTQKTQSASKGISEVQEGSCEAAGGTPKLVGECDINKIIYGRFENLGINKVCCRKDVEQKG